MAAPGPRLLGMAAAFVLQGVLNEELFLQPAFSGEMFLIFAKIHPFVKELREKLNDPNFFVQIEKVVTRTKWGRESPAIHDEARRDHAGERMAEAKRNA